MDLTNKYSKASLLLCLFISAITASKAAFLNVVERGAVADGKTDNTKVFQSAWNEACASEQASGVLIPQGSFLVGQLIFKGPCKNPIVWKLSGTMLAQTNLSVYSASTNWIAFKHVQNLTITGGGKLDGQGAFAWPENNCRGTKKCTSLPRTINFSSVKNATIENISSINAKSFHMQVYACSDMVLRSLTITAPDESPNTDGIHLSKCNNTVIKGAHIGTGDDCISIGAGNNNISISDVYCGPGHGISIGSLGGRDNEQDVAGISVTNCTIEGTQNGIRIKSWPDSPATLSATNLTFDDIIMKNVKNPILIDQEYCPFNLCNKDVSSKVKLSKIKFKNIRGDSLTKIAVNLLCSDSHPCEEILLHDINLKFEGDNAEANCQNAKGTTAGHVYPAPCLV